MVWVRGAIQVRDYRDGCILTALEIREHDDLSMVSWTDFNPGELGGTYEKDHSKQQHGGHEDRKEEQPSCGYQVECSIM